MSSWHSYPSIFALGHKALENLFDGHVQIEEKVDGSQFSFGKFDGELRCRSKGTELNVDAPEKMFSKAVETAKRLLPLLREGWTYRGEYLQSPKHNALAYDRFPEGHIILFDINTGYEQYLPYDRKFEEAQRLGLEVVPLFNSGKDFVITEEYIVSLLERESVLGGQKIEGIVVKNYDQFAPDKHCLMGKFVSEAFKEVHKGAWRESNPTQGDVTQNLIQMYRTPARWQKAVMHLYERGELDNSPRDIGKLIVEIGADVRKEEEEAIKEYLFNYFWPKVQRGIIAGFPEWYKEKLLHSQFENK